jgi:hypothetical protein
MDIPTAHKSPVGADLSCAPPIYRPNANLTPYSDYLIHYPNHFIHHYQANANTLTYLDEFMNQPLADLDILWYHLPNARLPHSWVSKTLREGDPPMPKRLAGYDYSQPGYYLVTICTQHHRLIFGTIVDAQVSLRASGQIADSVWMSLPR